MGLLQQVLRQGCRSVAIVGMAKNTGKTVTLNYLIRHGHQYGLRLALTSSGRDGEREDLVWHNPKPAVWVPEGTLLATAAESLAYATAGLKVLFETDYSTALGRVCLARVLSEGFVQLAGPCIGRELADLSRQLSSMADLVLIDGALDRMSSAAPVVADGLILATGAIIAPTMEQVLEQTQARIEQLQVPGVPDQLHVLLGNELGVRAIFADRTEALGLPSALGYQREITAYLHTRPEVIGLALPGALSESVVEAVKIRLGNPGGFSLVVEDGTKIFLPDRCWKSFIQMGGKVLARRPIRVLALTVNPMSPLGRGFAAGPFLELAQAYCGNLGVYDPCQSCDP